MAVRRRHKMKYQRELIAIEHTAFYGYLLRYNDAMRVRNYSGKTIRIRDTGIRQFILWCDERDINQPQDVTKPLLERYQKHLYYYRKENGDVLSSNTRGAYMVGIRQFFKWLTQENYLLYNPASELHIPRRTRSLPIVLSVEQIDSLMEQPNVNTPYGVRDRAILELLYSTGIRRLELCNLNREDINLSRHMLYVRKGKGNKDRVLPLGGRAEYWLIAYLETARKKLVVDVTDDALFLSDYGDRIRDTKLGDRVKRYLKRANINVLGSCHLLRHAMATHMLENGADVRYIQSMLGHAELTTTELYTHVSIEKLRAVHSATHPAKLDIPQQSEPV